MRRGAAALALIALLAAPAAAAQTSAGRVEVVMVNGVIDGTVVRSVTTAIRDAEREHAQAVVLELNSRGSLGERPVRQIADAARRSRVPVVTWVGPPGALAANGAAILAQAAHVRAMAPGAGLGPLQTADLRTRADPKDAFADVLRRFRRPARPAPTRAVPADTAQARGLVDIVAVQLPDLLREIDGRAIRTADGPHTPVTKPGEVSVRFRKGDIYGRALHATAQPSVAYLLLMAGLVGVVFELFHPSRGPAGLTGLLSLGLAGHGLWVMQARPFALVMILLGTAGLSVDLRTLRLGLPTAAGTALLAAGTVLLFGSPFLRANPLVLAFGLLAFLAFMISAMTRVLRDLRDIAAGERAIVDPVQELQRDDS